MWQQAALAAALISQEPRVPFEPGLNLTWAASLSGEPDYETRLTLVTTDSDTSIVRISWNRRSTHGHVRWISDERQLTERDRRLARSSNGWSKEGDTTEYRGSPYSMASIAVLDGLRRDGQVPIELLIPEQSSVPYAGVVGRVGSVSEDFPVLVNGQRVTLPGIRATGMLANPTAPAPSIRVNLLLLDNATAPWWLQLDVRRTDGTGGRRQLVQISYPSGRPDLAAELAARCRASVYDLYFATASAELDSASTPTLAAIARALHDHPGWQLTIVGHTDSIGGMDYNVDLSRRRADRVRAALVAEYRVAASRLRAEGRGEGQPVEDNGTMAGRAANRRVELVRVCGAR